MAKSRGNGQGSVTKIKDTKGKIKYQIRVTVGSEFDAEKEKFRYISKSLGVYKTKAEAEAVLAEYNSSPCRDYKFEYNSLSRVAYSQPVILFSYNGQKDKELGIAVKNLVYQAGKYTKFVDVFGGTGSASLAFPKRGYGEGKRGYVPYKYNDLDADLCNLYTVIKSEDYKVLIEELYKLKSALEGGEQLEGIDFNNEMIKFFNRATSASQKTRLSMKYIHLRISFIS